MDADDIRVPDAQQAVLMDNDKVIKPSKAAVDAWIKMTNELTKVPPPPVPPRPPKMYRTIPATTDSVTIPVEHELLPATTDSVTIAAKPGRLQKIRDAIKTQLKTNRFQNLRNKGQEYYDAFKRYDELGNEIRGPIKDNQLHWIAITLLVLMLICDGLLLGDLSKQHRNVTVGIHSTRIVVLVGIAITATISWVQGTGYGSVQPWLYILIKFIGFAITLAYTIVLGVQFNDPKNKSTLEIARLSLLAVLAGVSLILSAWGLLYYSEDAMNISFLSVIIGCAFGISLSGVALAILPTVPVIPRSPSSQPNPPSQQVEVQTKQPILASPPPPSPPSKAKPSQIFIPKPEKPVEQKIDRSPRTPPPSRPVSPISTGSTRIQRPTRPATP